jgi:hypothetical protein
LSWSGPDAPALPEVQELVAAPKLRHPWVVLGSIVLVVIIPIDDLAALLEDVKLPPASCGIRLMRSRGGSAS